ncbi:hypothetical protein BRC81_04815 [Halobacteriales archaeon QS_1_68_20]|nr:MAG: hypothetical protein BRC81_04815 [Halobacteriales archaeon QS_1_68_20]
MAVRPPSNDDDKPDAVDFGIAAMDAHLEGADLTFPATADEIVQALGDPEVDYDPSGNAVALSTVLEHVDRDRFDSRQELLDVLHPEFESLRRSSGGVVSWLKSLFPG